MTKICTDLQQSKRLVELGIDINTADMYWKRLNFNGDISWKYHIKRAAFPMECFESEDYVPAWSLTALLNVIPEPDLVQNSEGTWLLHSWVKAYPWSVGGYSNPVDACVDMIVKLHEKNLL